MAMIYSDPLRIRFNINRTVSFDVVAAAGLTIEQVHVVNPDIRIVSIQRHPVVHCTHDSQIAELNTLGVSHQESKTIDTSVLTNAFNGYIHLTVCLFSFELNSLHTAPERIDILFVQYPQDAYIQWISNIPFFIGIENRL